VNNPDASNVETHGRKATMEAGTYVRVSHMRGVACVYLGPGKRWEPCRVIVEDEDGNEREEPDAHGEGEWVPDDTIKRLASAVDILDAYALLSGEQHTPAETSVEPIFIEVNRTMAVFSEETTLSSGSFKVRAPFGEDTLWSVTAMSNSFMIEGRGASLMIALRRCAESVSKIVEESVSKAEATVTSQRNAAIALRTLLLAKRDQDV
jgi:hypothetical protein